MNKKTLVLPILAFLSAGLLGAQEPKMAKPGVYVVMDTNYGQIICELFPDKAPKTVANFVNLIEGTQEYIDLKTGQTAKGNFYKGLIFHRVIPGFMIQGGDPTGTGRGGPGYQFEDEFTTAIGFDQPGRLAMANSGPNTNGSQFFITEGLTPWLNMHHTIFGQVVQGMEVVTTIVNVPRGEQDRPLKDVVIEEIKVVRVNPAATKPTPVKSKAKLKKK
jgi:peptidyl-prolyl cis-trans isomerase A (cyclophilin A)